MTSVPVCLLSAWTVLLSCRRLTRTQVAMKQAGRPCAELAMLFCLKGCTSCTCCPGNERHVLVKPVACVVCGLTCVMFVCIGSGKGAECREGSRSCRDSEGP